MATTIPPDMKLYWTDIGTRKIQRSDLDGGNIEDLVSLSPVDTYVSDPLYISAAELSDVQAFVDECYPPGNAHLTDMGAALAEYDYLGMLESLTVINSMASLLGLNDIAALTAETGMLLETLLDGLPDGPVTLTPEVSSLISEAVAAITAQIDSIATYVAAPTGGQVPQPDVSDLIERLFNAYSGGNPVQPDIPRPMSDFQEPQGVAIDPDIGKMYWVNLERHAPDTEKVQRANLNGSNVEDVIVDERRGARDTALVGGKPHWFARHYSEIRRCDRDGSNPALVLDVSTRTADMSDTVKAHVCMAADESTRRLYIAFGDEIVRVAMTKAPTIASLADGDTAVSGVCDETDGTLVQVFVNGEPQGNVVSVLDGVWEKSQLDILRKDDVVRARAQAPGGTWSDDDEAIVEFVPTSATTPPAATTSPPAARCTRAVSPTAFSHSPVRVALKCEPEPDAISYVVDDVYPAGWTVADPGLGVDNGVSVRFLFGDGAPRDLAYTLVPPTAALAGSFSGYIATTDPGGTDTVPTVGVSEVRRVFETVATGLTLVRGLSLDLDAGKLYWVDGGADVIQRANLDGSDLETIVRSGFRIVRADGSVAADGFVSEDAAAEWLSMYPEAGPVTVVDGPVNPQRVVVYAGTIYWTDSGLRYGSSGRIHSLPEDGTGAGEVLVSGLDLPQGIAVGPDTPPATTTAPPVTTAPPLTTPPPPTTTTTTAPPPPTTTTTTPPPLVTIPPVVSEPIYDGETTASGTSVEPDGTVIQVYVNGVPAAGTTVVSGGEWTMTGLTLVTDDVVKATAQAPGKEVSGDSNLVVVLPLDAWGDPCGCARDTGCEDRGIRTYQLTLAVEGEGTVLPSLGTTTRPAGERVRLTAVPAPGWTLVRWRFDETPHSSRRTSPPISNSTDPSVIHAVEDDAIITAEFTPQPSPAA